MHEVLKITICNSLNEENCFYIFRENGVEVKIKIIDSKLLTSHKLTEIEKEYLKNNITYNNG